jgi:nucleotidyltransferase/DNA polymerase involved in DNA repair
VGELAKYPVEDLIKAFGKTLGLYFHNASNGVDEEPVQERGIAESMSRITTLKENTRDLNMILEDIHRLSDEIHERVSEQGLNFKTVSIVAVMEDLSIHSRSKTLSGPTDDLEIIRKTSRELLEGLLEKESTQLRRIGVKVSNLTVGQKQRRLTEFAGKD